MSSGPAHRQSLGHDGHLHGGHLHDDHRHGHGHGPHAHDRHPHHGRAHKDHAHGGHHHAHAGHTTAPATFGIALVVNAAFVAIEAAAGFFANSTALLADAGHNLSDVLGLALAGGAAWLARRPPAGRRTYGYGKAGVLAALANALVLVAATGAIGWEALSRLAAPEPTAPLIVMAAAALGIIVNGGTAMLFARGADVNARAAFLHLMADAGVSAAVIAAGALVWLTDAAWIDPAVSLAVVALIIAGAWRLLRQSLDLALDAAPETIDMDAVRAMLTSLPGVTEVHDLHVWAMSAEETALTAHLVRPSGGDDDFLHAARETLAQRFGIAHATLQIECGGGAACPGAHA